MKNRTRLILLLLIVLIVVIALGAYFFSKKHVPVQAAQQTQTSDTTSADLSAEALAQISNIWSLTTFDGVPTTDSGTLVITSAGSVTGTFDCSSFSGRANIAQNGTVTLFKVSKLVTAPIKCSKTQPAVESDFYAATQRDSGMKVTLDTNQFELNDSEFTFDFDQQNP